MKLALIRFDDMVTVPGGKVHGEAMTLDACESTFTLDGGWDINEVTPGVFTLRAEHMTDAFVVGGYGYGYIKAPEPMAASPKPATVSGDWRGQAEGKRAKR